MDEMTKRLQTELEVAKAALAIERQNNRKLYLILRYARKVLRATLNMLEKLDGPSENFPKPDKEE